MISGGPPSDVAIFTLLAVSAAASFLYFFFYMFRPWHSTAQGRALMTKAVGNVILLDLMAMPFALWGEYPYRSVVRLIGFSIFTVGIVYLLVTLLWSPGAKDYPPWSWRRRRMGDDREVAP